MMGKTHIAVGVAAALSLCPAQTPAALLADVIGGAVGGILCDIDSKPDSRAGDVGSSLALAAALTAACLAADAWGHFGLLDTVLQQHASAWLLGGGILLVTCVFGRTAPHRTFSHSLLFVALLAMGCYELYPPLLWPVAAGGITHLALDTLNKKPVPWLFPFGRPGICLSLCAADRLTNQLLLWLGLAVDAALLGLYLLRMYGG